MFFGDEKLFGSGIFKNPFRDELIVGGTPDDQENVIMLYEDGNTMTYEDGNIMVYG